MHFTKASATGVGERGDVQRVFFGSSRKKNWNGAKEGRSENGSQVT